MMKKGDRYKTILHNHPEMEARLRVPPGHVIIDEKVYNKLLGCWKVIDPIINHIEIANRIGEILESFPSSKGQIIND